LDRAGCAAFACSRMPLFIFPSIRSRDRPGESTCAGRDNSKKRDGLGWDPMR
jgi:hypothetical protein